MHDEANLIFNNDYQKTLTHLWFTCPIHSKNNVKIYRGFYFFWSYKSLINEKSSYFFLSNWSLRSYSVFLLHLTSLSWIQRLRYFLEADDVFIHRYNIEFHLWHYFVFFNSCSSSFQCLWPIFSLYCHLHTPLFSVMTAESNTTASTIHKCYYIWFLLFLFSSPWQLLKHLDVINIWQKHISSSLPWQIYYYNLFK